MKREYTQPTAKFIDYAYDEQVVAESNKFDGLGDGWVIDYCTYQSGEFSDPCTVVVNSQFSDEICGIKPWSLRP